MPTVETEGLAPGRQFSETQIRYSYLNALAGSIAVARLAGM